MAIDETANQYGVLSDEDITATLNAAVRLGVDEATALAAVNDHFDPGALAAAAAAARQASSTSTPNQKRGVLETLGLILVVVVFLGWIAVAALASIVPDCFLGC